MSNKQLETFFAIADRDKSIQTQIDACDLNNSCISDLGQKYGHKFSPATVSHWYRQHPKK